MSNKKSPFVPAALIFTSFLGMSAAKAGNPACYTVASLQGSYAIIGTYGSNLAITLGAEYLDGNGNLMRSAVVNEPTPGSTTGERTITTNTNTGTYTVNCDGTGKFYRNLTQANGATASQVDDFIITGAILKGGQLIATTIVDAQEVPSAVVQGGVFLTRVHTRLPDRSGQPQL